jgi:hypothetical protein
MVGGTWSTNEKGQTRYAGGKWIEVAYSRPVLRGRTNIFGQGADYGKAVNAGAPVWRAGANQTTKLTTEVPLDFGGTLVAPGSYSVFVDLKESGWTLILSAQVGAEKWDPNDKNLLWGSDGYDPKLDVARVPMTMIAPAVSVDQFTIAFVDVTNKGGKLAMVWEKTGALVPFAIAAK